MLDIYCIGEMVIDFIPGNEANSYIRNAGGAPANVAIAAARNHLKVGMCCKVGADDFGLFLLETLSQHGVMPICTTRCEEATTTMAFVTLGSDGERSFTFARKPGADMFLDESDVLEADIAQAAIIHAGSCSLSAEPAASATLRALRIGKDAGKLVSFDVNYRDLMWNNDPHACVKKVLEALPYIDLLKVSDEEVKLFGGQEKLVSLMEQFHISVLVETLGSHGAQAHFHGKTLYVEGLPAKAVDTTGAGDAFGGGFQSSLRIQGINQIDDLSIDRIQTALRFGNAAGYWCVQKKGAIPALPCREEIESVLASTAN